MLRFLLKCKEGRIVNFANDSLGEARLKMILLLLRMINFSANHMDHDRLLSFKMEQVEDQFKA